MQGGIRELAKQAAAAAKAEREAQGLALEPGRKYRGVKGHYGCYGAEIRDPASNSRRVWLGAYEAAEEAAYAYDFAARAVQGPRAKPNFPAPPRAPGEEEDVAAAVVLAHFADVKRRQAERRGKRAEKQSRHAERLRRRAERQRRRAEKLEARAEKLQARAEKLRGLAAGPQAAVEDADSSVTPPAGAGDEDNDKTTSQVSPSLALVPLGLVPSQSQHATAQPQQAPTVVGDGGAASSAAPQPLAFAFPQPLPSFFPNNNPAPAPPLFSFQQAPPPPALVPTGEHFFYQQQPPLAAAATNAPAFQPQSTVPPGSGEPEMDVPLYNWLMSTANDPAWKPLYDSMVRIGDNTAAGNAPNASRSRAAAPPPPPKRQRLETPPTLFGVPSPGGAMHNLSVTGSNFMGDIGASSSSAAAAVVDSSDAAAWASLIKLCARWRLI